MAERLQCPLCKKEFENKREKFVHLDRHGCPVARKVINEIAAPLCACGCGNKVNLGKRTPKYFNEYIRGHNKYRKRKQSVIE